jgi:hypothetical protein
LNVPEGPELALSRGYPHFDRAARKPDTKALSLFGGATLCNAVLVHAAMPFGMLSTFEVQTDIFASVVSQFRVSAPWLTDVVHVH